MGFLDILRVVVKSIANKTNEFEEKHNKVSMRAARMTDEQLKIEYRRSVECGRSLEKVVYKKELESRGYVKKN